MSITCRPDRKLRHAKPMILLGLAILFALSGCGSLPKDVSRPVSYADTDNTRIGRARRDELRRHPGESGFLVLGNGLDRCAP